MVTVPQIVSKGRLVYASIVAFFAWMFSVYDFILFGTLLPLIAKQYGWSTATSTAIASWVALGTFLVSLTVGPLADYLGRRNALLATTVGAALSSGLTALTFSPVYLILVRSLSGFGYSEQAVNTTYLSEIYGARRRGFLYSFVQGGWPIGVLFAAFMTGILLPSVGWRGVFLVATFPAIVIAVLRLRLPESPRFAQMHEVRTLLAQGADDQARQVGASHGINVGKARRFTYAQLFDADVAKHTVFLGLAFLLNWFSIQTFAVLGTTILTAGKGLTFQNSLFLLILSNALAFIGYVLHGYLGDIMGRRETIIGAWVLAALCYTLMLVVAHTPFAVLVTYSAGLFFQIGAYSALFTYMGESFPTRMRGTGAAFINAMGPIGGILGSVVFTIALKSHVSIPDAAVWSGAIPLFLSAILLLGARRVPPGKTLEEIIM